MQYLCKKGWRGLRWVRVGVGCACILFLGLEAEAQDPKTRLSWLDKYSKTDPQAEGLTWGLVLPNLDAFETKPVVVGRDVDENIELFERWRDLDDLMPVESILWASSQLYLAIQRMSRPAMQIRRPSGPWLSYDADMLERCAQQRDEMVALLRDTKSSAKRLIGSMAIGFLGELEQNRNAAEVLFKEGLTHDHPLVRVKSAIAIVMGGSVKDRTRLIRAWGRLQPDIQDRVVSALLDKSVRKGVDGFHLLPILGKYLRSEVGRMVAGASVRHHPEVVDAAVRSLDLISLETLLRGNPAWLLRLKANRWEAIREFNQRMFAAVGTPPDPPPLAKIPDADLVIPEINLVSAAMFVVLNTPEPDRQSELYQVAVRVALNEIDRVTDLPTEDSPTFEFLYGLLQLIRRQDLLRMYEPLLAIPDKNIQAWAAAAILMKNWEFDGMEPKEGAHPKAVTVFQELLDSGFIPHKMRRPLKCCHVLQGHLRRLKECSEPNSP